ncbi:hypothetical protein [Haloferula sargassicola]|uniref:PEP-CTERM protein-sorting domain-containing protein n=1 Tax=Haloferula sargassicola TaxID=490096 RepID=A0ABP9UYQ7_9BACT
MRFFLAALSLSLPASALVSIGFDSSDDLSTNFNVAGGTAGTSTIVSGAGFDGSGGVVNATATRTHAFTLSQSFAGDLSSWSTHVLWNPGSSNASQFIIGVAESPDVFMTGAVPAAAQDAVSNSQLMGTIYSLFAAGGNAGINVQSTEQDGGLINHDETSGTLGLNTWYQVGLDVSFNGGISYTATATISSVDGAGNPVAPLISASSTFDHATLAADSEVYPFFGVTDTGGTLDRFETTAIVPEPHLLLLSSLSVGLLLARRRRFR